MRPASGGPSGLGRDLHRLSVNTQGDGPLGCSRFIAPIASLDNHAILNHLQGRHSQVAKATVCKVSPRNLVRVRKCREANGGPASPSFVAGQKRTGEDALGLSCGPNSVRGRKTGWTSLPSRPHLTPQSHLLEEHSPPRVHVGEGHSGVANGVAASCDTASQSAAQLALFIRSGHADVDRRGIRPDGDRRHAPARCSPLDSKRHLDGDSDIVSG